MNTAQFTPAGTMTAEDLGRIHLIGVGGVGMSGLARLFLTRGLPVSGSELREWPSLAGLRALGGTIHMSHEASNLDGVDTVVYSTAIPQDHLETGRGPPARGLRVLHRSEALAAAMTGRRTVAVAGTHGKTTTTSMVTMVLQQAGLIRPSSSAARSPRWAPARTTAPANISWSRRTRATARSCIYRPYVSIITNIEADHLNTYGDLASLEAAFAGVRPLTDPDGFLVTCADDPRGRRLAETGCGPRGVGSETYGEADDADLRHERHPPRRPPGVRYLAELDGRIAGRDPSCRYRAGTWGSTAPPRCSPPCLLGCRSARSAEAALAAFPGVRRRFERKGVADGVLVYDEYAYHPTAMTLALQTLREVAGDGRLLVVFQPYRLYRTRDLQRGDRRGLGIADEAVLMEVFGPGEPREPGEGSARVDRGGAAASRAEGLRRRVGGRRRPRWLAGPGQATWW